MGISIKEQKVEMSAMLAILIHILLRLSSDKETSRILTDLKIEHEIVIKDGV